MDNLELDNYTEVNDGTQEVTKEVAYNISLTDPVCPCCGKRLKIVDSVKNQFGQDLKLTTENKFLKENAFFFYLLDICGEEALNIYETELAVHEPYYDTNGNIEPEYNTRFEYTDPQLKRIVKVKANAIANKLANDNIKIDPYYIENEIIEMLKHIH